MEEEQRKHRAEMEALQARLQQAQGQRNRLMRAFEGLQGWYCFQYAHRGCSPATRNPDPHWCCHQAAAPDARLWQAAGCADLYRVWDSLWRTVSGSLRATQRWVRSRQDVHSSWGCQC